MKQYTKEDLKEIKMLLNDYVVQNDFDFIYNNLHLIGYTCEAIRKTSKPFAKSMNNSDIEYKNIPVYTGKFRLDIVRKYLNRVNELVILKNFYTKRLKDIIMKSYKWKPTKTMCIYCLNIIQKCLFQIL